MKKLKFIYLISLIVLFSSCNEEFMERYPLDQLAPETFFKTENDLISYTNSFYTIVPDWSSIWYQNYADDEGRYGVDANIAGNRTVPTTGGGWTWGDLRNINFFIENIYKYEGDLQTKNHYEGLARFFRAWFYFEKVKRFGDVPWYSKAIDANDEEALTKPRDSRFLVMDSILLDINHSIQHLSQNKSTTKITKWTALALKSRIFLYEGTFRKYHGLGDYERMLDESISASLELMQNSGYTIYKSSPDKAYQELFIAQNAIADEMILAREYNLSIPYTHSVNFYTNSSSYGRPGVLKPLINSYLMNDGTRFTDLPEYNKMGFYEECQNRDPRLSQTIRTPGYKQIGEENTSLPDFSNTMTGYQYIKYVLAPVHFSSGCDNDLPVFRFAEVLLNYSEAKAEKGVLTQEDLDMSIKLIRDRVDMPNINLSWANANPDPFLGEQYINVSGANRGVILEIRRERRIELIREGFRWDDIMRWKEGHNLPKLSRGMYFPGPGEFDLDNDGSIDLVIYEGNSPSDKIPGVQYFALGEIDLEFGVDGGNMVINRNITKVFDENKDYLYPIPIQERLLNPNLTQNPGWNDGLGY